LRAPSGLASEELIECIPAEYLWKRADLIPAGSPVELRRAAHMPLRGRCGDRFASGVALVQHDSCHAQRAIAVERLLERLESPRSKVEVGVHLRNDVPLHVELRKCPMKRLELVRLCESVTRGRPRRTVKDNDFGVCSGVLLGELTRAVGRAVVDENEEIGRPALAGHRRKERRKAPFLVEE
jgi:hypothetical protein